MKDISPPSTASLGFGIGPNAISRRLRSAGGSTDSGRKARILVVDPDPDLSRLTNNRLSAANYRAELVETSRAALDACVRSRPNLVIADLRLEPMSGLALLKELKSRWPELTVMILTAHATIPEAVQATQLGAFSFLVKPVERIELLAHVERAIAVSTFALTDGEWQYNIEARSRLMDDRLALANRAARSDVPVLLTGENATGKELLARAIHAASARRGKPFVTVSCRTAIEHLLECELFGRETSDASGTAAGRSGAFHSARGGTLLVDEIGNLPARLQLKFVEALGDVRLICTTSCDLKNLVDIGRLRGELYEQVHVLPIEIPPSGRRREDIPLLVSHFLEQATDPSDNKNIYSPRAIELLATTEWPESVRHLFDLVKQNVALSHGKVLTEAGESRIATFDEAREKFSHDYLAENLRMTKGNVSKSARLAKRTRTDFYRLLARYRLRPLDFKNALS
jgi:two-component system response regulator GlrR